MKTMPFGMACLWCMIALVGSASAQTPVVAPVVRQPVVTGSVVTPSTVAPSIVTQRVPAVVERAAPLVAPPVVAARPVVRETLVSPARTVAWWDAFGKLRYGFYDDGFTDDNWFYDYYEAPPATVAVEQPVAVAPGARTSWRYDPQVEQRLFRW